MADVTAIGPVRCSSWPARTCSDFLLAYPTVMYRMLQAVARRLGRANRRG